tara:strand:+ start:100 stop:417 length:318 start_codon:yes stop_codon:yes gene_type:complete
MLQVVPVVLEVLELMMVILVDLVVVEDILTDLQVQETPLQLHPLREILVVLDLHLLAHMVVAAVVVPVVLVVMALVVKLDMVVLVFNYQQHLETLYLHLDPRVVV